MDFLQGIILGVLQGIAEFLPISSSGHLVVLRELMGLGDIPGLFDVLLHVATLIVVIVVYRVKIGKMLKATFLFVIGKAGKEQEEDLRWVLPILIGTVITAGLGFLLKSFELTDNPQVAYWMFIVTGLILLTPLFIKDRENPAKPGLLHGLLVGLSQGIGVLPGISRSGITITTGRLLGLSRKDAGEFSFLLSIPAILGAMVLELRDFGELTTVLDPLVLLVSFAVTVAVGFAALLGLLKLLNKGKLYFFSFYLIPMGLLGIFGIL